MVWKQLSQLSFTRHGVKSREESQDSRVSLKQGRNCRANTVLFVLFALPMYYHKWAMGMEQQKFPGVQLSIGVGETRAAYAQMAFIALSERGSQAVLDTSFQRAAGQQNWCSHPFSILSRAVKVLAKPSSPQAHPQCFHDAGDSLFMLLSSGETGFRVNQTLLSARWLGDLVCFGAYVSHCSHESMKLPDLCKTWSSFCFFRKKTPIPSPLPLTLHTTAYCNTTFQIPRVHKTKKECNYTPYTSPRDRFLAGCMEDTLQNCCQQAAADVVHRIPFFPCWICAACAPALGKTSWGHSLI